MVDDYSSTRSDEQFSWRRSWRIMKGLTRHYVRITRRWHKENAWISNYILTFNLIKLWNLFTPIQPDNQFCNLKFINCFQISLERWRPSSCIHVKSLSSKITFNWMALLASKTSTIGQQTDQKNYIQYIKNHNREHYVKMLRNCLRPQIEAVGNNKAEVWFQQDGGTSHTSKCIYSSCLRNVSSTLDFTIWLSRLACTLARSVGLRRLFIRSFNNAKFTVLNLVQSTIWRLRYVNKLLHSHKIL